MPGLYGFSTKAGIPDNHLSVIFQEIRSLRPCVVLIEDIDSVIRGRTNISGQPEGLSFDTLINTIDGAVSMNGVAVAITTNDLSAIDPALGRPKDESQWNSLSTRPGRLDRCIRFDNPDDETRRSIAKMFLEEDEALEFASKYTDYSLVQFKTVCQDRALEHLQNLDQLCQT